MQVTLAIFILSVVIGNLAKVLENPTNDRTNITLHVKQLIHQREPHFFQRVKRSDPHLTGHVTVPRKCGLRHSHGDFLLTGRLRLNSLSLRCASYLHEWRKIQHETECTHVWWFMAVLYRTYPQTITWWDCPASPFRLTPFVQQFKPDLPDLCPRVEGRQSGKSYKTTDSPRGMGFRHGWARNCAAPRKVLYIAGFKRTAWLWENQSKRRKEQWYLYFGSWGFVTAVRVLDCLSCQLWRHTLTYEPTVPFVCVTAQLHVASNSSCMFCVLKVTTWQTQSIASCIHLNKLFWLP